MTLSLKSTITGLAKISGVDPPNEVELELLANDAFTRADKDHDQRITKEQFALYCRRNPEVRSWVEYYDDPPDPGAGRPDERHLAVEGEPAVCGRAITASLPSSAPLTLHPPTHAGGGFVGSAHDRAQPGARRGPGAGAGGGCGTGQVLRREALGRNCGQHRAFVPASPRRHVRCCRCWVG